MPLARRAPLLPPLVLLALAACSGAGSGTVVVDQRPPDAASPDAPPPATATGSVRTTRLSVSRSAWADVPESGGASVTEVVLSSADYCAAASANAQPRSSQVLQLYLGVATGGGGAAAVTSPGLYPVARVDGGGGARFASVSFFVLDTYCSPTDYTQASAGVVTIAAVSPTTLSGTFDLTMSTGDRLAGTFDAPRCAALASPPRTDGGTLCR